MNLIAVERSEDNVSINYIFFISYDYDAPIGESGRYTDKVHSVILTTKNLLIKFYIYIVSSFMPRKR